MSNTENPRNTQFAGFAKLLMKDLDAVSTTTYANLGKAREAYELAIARRAYDLAMHVIEHTDPEICGEYDAPESKIRFVPDLTEWPSNP